MAMRRTCPRCDEPLDGTCARCGGLWLTRDELSTQVAGFLARHGHEDGIVAFHEAPVCDSPYDCPGCRRPMARVRLRGVTVEGCNECTGLLLDQASIELISRRMLVSARNRAPSRPRRPGRGAHLENALTRHRFPPGDA
jgi:Zn-finger nucleic acid-binding protein